MGCGASGINDSNTTGTIYSSESHRSNYKGYQNGGKINIVDNKKTPIRLNNQNTYNDNRNKNGFKQVDIKYADQGNKSDIKSHGNKGDVKNNSLANNNNNNNNNNNKNYNNKTSNQSKANISNNNNNNKNNNNGRNNNDIRKTSNFTNDNKSYVKEAVAFTITFDNNNNVSHIDDIVKGKQPNRPILAPIHQKPKITQAELDKKMRAVEKKREQILAKRIEASRSEIIKAEQVQQNKLKTNESGFNKIQNSLESANKQREVLLDDRRTKQRIVDEKRQRIIKQRRDLTSDEINELKYNDFEKDNYYNKGYDDF